MRKGEILERLLDAMLPDVVTVLEVGRLRAVDPGYQHSDGWSTLVFATHPRVERLVSLDIDPRTLEACAAFPDLASERVVFAERLCGADDGVYVNRQWLPTAGARDPERVAVDRVDFLYLDAEDDPEATVRHFAAAAPLLAWNSLIVVDDAAPGHHGHKGEALMPLLLAAGYCVGTMGPMLLASRGCSDVWCAAGGTTISEEA